MSLDQYILNVTRWNCGMFAQDSGQYARERVDGSESGLREVLAMRRQMLWERSKYEDQFGHKSHDWTINQRKESDDGDKG